MTVLPNSDISDRINNSFNSHKKPSQIISDMVSSSIDEIIAYDSTLYGKSQIFGLIRNTRKVYENDLSNNYISEKIKEKLYNEIENNYISEKIKEKLYNEIKSNSNKKNINELGKLFAKKWLREIYKIDSMDREDHSTELFDIYIDLKTKRANIESKFEYLEDALSEDLGIKQYKIEIHVYNKNILKQLPNLKTNISSFDEISKKEENKYLLKDKLADKVEDLQILLEKQYKQFSKVNKHQSPISAEGYAYNALKKYFKQYQDKTGTKRIETFFDISKITKGQFLNKHSQSPLYTIYKTILEFEESLYALKNKIAKIK